MNLAAAFSPPEMKLFTLLLLPVLCCGQESTAPPAAAPDKPPLIRRVASLDACPEAVRTAVKKNGHDKGLTEINVIETNGVKSYSFETGTEDDGVDREINYFYSSEGVLQRTEKDIPLKTAPEAVQAVLAKLAGTTAVVDDVEEVTAGEVITYKAELESNGGVDRKVIVSAAGDVIKLEEESDD
jgi:hypothetical protein